MFSYLCSYHQVPPSFLDNLFLFGSTLEPLDWGLAGFRQDNTLVTRKEAVLSIPRLGRSGREIRHSYSLRGVEPSDSVPNWPWSIRQIAVYQSFDVVTGRTVLITIKGNSLMKDRIVDSISDGQTIRPDSFDDISSTFAANLEINAGIFLWVDENWRWCVNDMEKNIRPIVNKAKTAKIDVEPRFRDMPEDIKHSVSRAGTFRSKMTAQTNTLVGSTKSEPTGINRFIKRFSFKRDTVPLITADRPSAPAGGKDSPQNQLDSLLILDMFSFEEMQKLQDTGEKVQEALLVHKINLAVLGQIRASYQEQSESMSSPELDIIMSGCRNELISFYSRISGIENNMKIRIEQLESLVQLVKDAKDLVSLTWGAMGLGT